MATSAVGSGDLDWIVQVFEHRRESLVQEAPVFWRPAVHASAKHRAFLEYLLSEGGATGFRTHASVLLAVPEGDGWLVDDADVQGSDWATGDGRDLWNALDRVAHGAQVRLVCPTYEGDRAEFARQAGLSITESWWLIELAGGSGGEAGVRVELPGAVAITVAAPPIYDPLGPILFLPNLSDARSVLPAATSSASRLGCPAVVVNQAAGDDTLAKALLEAGFRRHCDFYSGAIDSI